MQNKSFLIQTENYFINYKITNDIKYWNQCEKNILQLLSERTFFLEKSDGLLVGPSLIFYSVQTKKEEVKSIIEHLKQQASFLMESVYLKERIKPIPFLIAYETMINKTENYSEVIKKIQDIKKEFYKEETGLYGATLEEDSMFLDMLADCILLASEEIFEYYQRLRLQLREAIWKVLTYQNPRTGFYGEEEATCLENSARIAIAIWKACCCNVLLPYKYQKQSFKTANFLIGSFKDYKLLPYETFLQQIKEL